MKRAWLWALPGVFLLVVLGAAAWAGLVPHPSTHAAERFLAALCAGDLPKARELSSGRVAWDLARQPYVPKAEVVDLSVSVVAQGERWAKLQATLELVLADGARDVGWYDLDLVRNGRGWTVARMDGADMPVFGWSAPYRFAWPDLQKPMEGYLTALTKGDYAGAGRFLAGPARRAHEQAAPLLEHGKVIGEFKNLRSETLWLSGKRAVVRFSYEADGRDAVVQAFMYRTGDGWKLVGIHPG